MCCDMNPHRYIMCLYSYHGRKHLQQILTNHLDPLITQLRKNHQIIHCLKLTARPLKIGGNGRRLGSFPFGAISAYFAKVNLLLVLGVGSPYGWWFRNPASQLSSLFPYLQEFLYGFYTSQREGSRSCSQKKTTHLGPQNTQSSKEAEAETL